MHEFGITQSILDTALEKSGEAGATKITAVNIVLGELSGIVEECVRFYFDFMTRDTAAAGATLNVEKVPANLRCRDCQAEFLLSDSAWFCPKCNKPNVDILSGRECSIESIEVE